MTKSLTRVWTVVSIGALVVTGLSGCGSSSKSAADTTTSAGSSSNAQAGSTSTTAAAGSGAKVSTTKPTVVVPDGPPPTDLQIKDITVGTGAEATKGSSVTVQYVGVSYSTKKQFDASWDRGEPFTFTLGAGNVIQGWDQGVLGMKVGGRRELTIPPSLGYGAQGAPPDIAANETLIFIVDLVSVG